MTTNHPEHIDRLLVKAMLGEASEPDREAVSEWLGKSHENREYYRQFQTIWERSRALETRRPVDENLAWEKFRERVRTEPEQAALYEPEERLSIRGRYPYLKIAAAVLVVLGLAVVIFLNLPAGKSGPEVFASGQKAQSRTLADGSVVYLNRNSRITSSATLGADPVRKVSLEGEAFFVVAPDARRPFLISIDDVEVQVLGTSFNVKTFPDRTEVIVATGKVEVRSDGKSRTLLPGQALSVPKGSGEWRQEAREDDLYHYYTQPKLNISQLPLSKVVEVLSEYYNTPIKLSSRLASDSITTTLDLDKPLKSNLDIINDTMGTRYEDKNGTIVLE